MFFFQGAGSSVVLFAKCYSLLCVLRPTLWPLFPCFLSLLWQNTSGRQHESCSPQPSECIIPLEVRQTRLLCRQRYTKAEQTARSDGRFEVLVVVTRWSTWVWERQRPTGPTHIKPSHPKTPIDLSYILQCTDTVNTHPYPCHSTTLCLLTKYVVKEIEKRVLFLFVFAPGGWPCPSEPLKG